MASVIPAVIAAVPALEFPDELAAETEALPADGVAFVAAETGADGAGLACTAARALELTSGFDKLALELELVLVMVLLPSELYQGVPLELRK